MGHTIRPQYDASTVNRSARLLAASDAAGVHYDDAALEVVNNWRASHDYPLNSIHMTLKGRANRTSGVKAITAQRIKRLDSIVLKLQDRPTMKLSQMQDIGGCRVIVPTLEDVWALRDLYHSSPVVHDSLMPKDYIAEPVADSGYRSLHLKFRFKGRGSSEPWDGLKIEMQIRTALQHQWATAVEAAGTIKVQAFKSRRGDEDWRRFFALVSCAFAYKEKTAHVPMTPETYSDLIDEIRALNGQNHITTTLHRYAAVISQIKRSKDAHFYVMSLNPDNLQVELWEFAKSEAARSAVFLAELEQRTAKPVQVVRVSVESLKALERAYPNYFLDTRQFVAEVNRLLPRRVVVARRSNKATA
jgi:hypothetical protein